MITKEDLKQFAQACACLKKVKIESMDNKECFVKKFSVKDSLEFTGKSQTEIGFIVVQVGIVDESGNRLFDTIEDVHNMPPAVIQEMASLVSEHNSEGDMEQQAKKS